MMIVKRNDGLLNAPRLSALLILICAAPGFQWAGCTERHKNRETRAKERGLSYKMLREMRFKQGNAGR